MTLTLITVAPKSDPNADATYLRVPEGLDLGSRWVDHERAVASYVPEGWFLCGVTQEGRERDTCFHMSWLHAALYDYAWPAYECVGCLGSDPVLRCKCQMFELLQGGVEVGALRAVARDVWSVVAERCGLYDPGRR